MKVCLVCNSNDFRSLYSNSLLKCENCGFVTANLSITEEELKKIYSKDYFYGEEYQNYLEDKKIIQKNFIRRLEFIFKKVSKELMRNSLEIGCAYGFFGEVLTNRTNTSYSGFDISEEGVAYASDELKLNATTRDYILSDKPANAYTDVFLWDVIEHLSSPDLYLLKISQEVEKGGRIYITTGNIEAVLAKIQKKKWRLIHPPSHLHYFSKKTIRILLEKYGFVIDDLHYLPVYRSLRQIFYSLFLLNKKSNGFKNLVYKLIPVDAYFKINTFDIMFVLAKKI